MNFVQQLEECLRDLAAEARKKHPGVKEASERATLKLRSLQNQYIQAVRAATSTASAPPTTEMFKSSELLHPFLLAANYPNASKRLLEISFRAMKLLMEAQAVLPSDAIHLIRVWMIQAQVVVGFYQKQYDCHDHEGHETDTAHPKLASSLSSSSSTSWFSWSSSSAKTAATGPMVTTDKVKNAVSSSSGQTGLSHASSSAMEKLAKDILSCLLQLIQLDIEQIEVWTNAVALSCVWFSSLPQRHTVYEAARSTAIQVLNGVYRSKDSKLILATWQDLLLLSTRDHKRLSNLSGAFRLCTKMNASSNALCYPPSPELALEFMVFVWKEHDLNLPDRVMAVTMESSLSLLMDVNKKKTSVELTLRTMQWMMALLSSKSTDYPNECRELLGKIMQPVMKATEACRTHHDFEDGFIYTRRSDADTKSLTTLIPPLVLWKAGFALEASFTLLQMDDVCHSILFDLQEGSSSSSGTIVTIICEALSDFATICASCQSHILQLIEYTASSQPRLQFYEPSTQSHVTPTVMRRAEHALTSGNASIFQSTSANAERQSMSSVSADSDNMQTSLPSFATKKFSVLGESLWLSLQSLLRIIRVSPRSSVKEAFAPSLAVWQHVLKRFVGSNLLVQLALKGYVYLADQFFPAIDSSLQRKTLLSSLCKLSLPSWGKHDGGSQLQDHHICALLYLFRIVQSHYNHLAEDWEVILLTLEELSVLSIASSQLHDEAYHAALAVSVMFERFAAFSTCFSTQSLKFMVTALNEVTKSVMCNRDIVGDSATVLPKKFIGTPATTNTADPHENKATISGKIIEFGTRAIYRASSEAEHKAEEEAHTDRTKNSFYEDYRREYVLRLSTSQNAIRVNSVGRIPFSLALLTDVIMANSFRNDSLGGTFSDVLSDLSASSTPSRAFVTDVMSMFTMSLVSSERGLPAPFIGPGKLVFAEPMQSQIWAVEPVEGWQTETITQGKSQSQHLAPVCHTIRTTEKAAVAESALGSLTSVLEGVGHNLTGEVWCDVIDSIASLSGDPSYELDRTASDWSGCCLMAFRALKFVVDDFLEQISSCGEMSDKIRSSLLDCCFSFGCSSHDVNTSLTAIGLLWTIADQDTKTDAIDLALSKFVRLASDDRAEVRNAAINTLFSCIIGRGGSFSLTQWESFFNDSIFGVYDVVTSKIDDGNKNEDHISEQSTRYKVSLHHSRDSMNKQWVSTQVVVLRGLVRVLRNHFSQLLDSTDVRQDEVPWFQDAWVRILDIAFYAASQPSGRDTLDIRMVGVELLLICCQLSSKSGIQAISAPAKVGTNMEVVNGALRSVRESQDFKSSGARVHSILVEECRTRLFLEAFEGLESFKDLLEKTPPTEVDETLLQILNKLCVGMAQLFECCQANELVPDGPNVNCFDSLSSSEDRSIGASGLGMRFVRIISTIVSVSSVDPKSRFLNQSQRGALALLRLIASNGSIEAFGQLILLGGRAFFFRDAIFEESNGSRSPPQMPELSLVSIEAATIVSEEVIKESVAVECKALILYKVLLLFPRSFDDNDTQKNEQGTTRYYKRMVPVVSTGLASILRLQAMDQGDKISELVWDMVVPTLSQMLSPVPIGNGLTKIDQVSEMIELVEVVFASVPQAYASELCTALSFGASKSFEVAKQQDSYASLQRDSEFVAESRQVRNETLRLFELCYSSLCALKPEASLLRTITDTVLREMVESDKLGSGEPSFAEETVLIVCRVLKKHKRVDCLVLSVFSLLCKLVLSDVDSVRRAVGEVFDSVNLADALHVAQVRYENAEQRVLVSEKRVRDLQNTVEELKKKNSELQREVAILEASTAL